MPLEGETLTMAATDRYRFAVAEVPATATVKPLERPLTTLIPAGILAPLAKHLKSHEGSVGIGIIENGKDVVARATLAMGDTIMRMRPWRAACPSTAACSRPSATLPSPWTVSRWFGPRRSARQPSWPDRCRPQPSWRVFRGAGRAARSAG
ncbi:hypothetical protein [Streptomyces sp. NPDC019507]|uniref:DNA polymerase III subunit beta family protein n=1 Tax=Streptomyces sp. NPDC019507 TaxID=3154689 RepID=UPI00340D1532